MDQKPEDKKDKKDKKEETENKKEKKGKKEKQEKQTKSNENKKGKQNEKKNEDDKNDNKKKNKQEEETGYKIPETIFKVDESGTIDYSKGLDLYNIKNIELNDENIKASEVKGLDSILNALIEKKVLCGGKNIEKLKGNAKLFLLYELIFNDHTSLALNELFLLDIIKSILKENPDINLIIQIADDDLYSKGKFKYNQVSKFGIEKVENVLKYLTDGESTKYKIHIFSNTSFRLKDHNYESLVSNFKMKVSFEKVTKLFNITDDDPVSAIDYPCYIAIAANPSIYTQYIPDLTNDYTCLIINSIYNMYRYQLCFDAAQEYKFNEPILLSTKIIPPLTGTNGYECNYNSQDDTTMLTTDEEKALRKKIMKHSVSGSRGSGSLEDHKKLGGDVIKDISCQYLAFIEKDIGKFNDYIEKFGKGELTCGEIKDIMFKCANELFKVVREAKNVNVNDFLILKDG